MAAASLVSFTEPYQGLYEWAHPGTGCPARGRIAWLLQVDVFLSQPTEWFLGIAEEDRRIPLPPEMGEDIHHKQWLCGQRARRRRRPSRGGAR